MLKYLLWNFKEFYQQIIGGLVIEKTKGEFKK